MEVNKQYSQCKVNFLTHIKGHNYPEHGQGAALNFNFEES